MPPVQFIFLLFSLFLVLPAAEAADKDVACGAGTIHARTYSVYTIDRKPTVWSRLGAPDVVAYSAPDYVSMKDIAQCGTGVVTAFQDAWGVNFAYYSPDCLNLGGGGETIPVFHEDHHADIHNQRISIIGLLYGNGSHGIYSDFYNKESKQQARYFSPDCRNIGGGGNTVLFTPWH